MTQKCRELLIQGPWEQCGIFRDALKSLLSRTSDPSGSNIGPFFFFIATFISEIGAVRVEHRTLKVEHRTLEGRTSGLFSSSSRLFSSKTAPVSSKTAPILFGLSCCASGISACVSKSGLFVACSANILGAMGVKSSCAVPIAVMLPLAKPYYHLIFPDKTTWVPTDVKKFIKPYYLPVLRPNNTSYRRCWLINTVPNTLSLNYLSENRMFRNFDGIINIVFQMCLFLRCLWKMRSIITAKSVSDLF